MRSVLRCVGHVPILPEAETAQPVAPAARAGTHLPDTLLLWALRATLPEPPTQVDGAAVGAVARGFDLAGAGSAWPSFHEAVTMLSLAPDRPLHAIREAVALVQVGALAPASLRLSDVLPATIARLVGPPLVRFARCYADAGMICRVRLEGPPA